MSSYSDYANAVSRILESQGNAMAQGQAQSGQIWGQALGNIGTMVANLPAQLAQQKTLQLQQQHLQMQADALKQAQSAQQQANAVLAAFPKNADGTYDAVALQQQLASRNVPLDAQERLVKSIEGVNGVITSAAKAKTDHLADLANVILTQHKDGEPITPDTVHLGFAAARAAGLATDADEQKFVELMGQGADPAQVLKTVRGLGGKYNAPPKYQALPANSAGIVNEATGQITPTGAPPRITNESELLLAAADPAHPLHAQAVAAQELKRQPTADQLADNARQAATQAETMRHNRAEEAIARAREGRESADTKGDAKAIADAIKSGDQPPSVTGLYRFAGPVRAELARQGYDFTKANLDWEATKKHLATLNGAQQTRLRQAISTASDSLSVIEDLAKQWDGGKFPILNKATLAAAKNGALGPKAQQIATNLTAQITDVTSELGNVYMGGNSPTDHALQLAGKNLSADWTRDQLLSAVKLARTNLQIRQNSITNSGAITTSGAQGAPAAPPAGRIYYDATGKQIQR